MSTISYFLGGAATVLPGLVIVLLCGTVTSSCSEQRAWSGEGHVGSIYGDENEISLRLRADVSLAEVVDFSTFGAVTPGMSVLDIERLLGKKAEPGSLWGSPSFNWDLEKGEVMLVKRRIQSDDFSGWKWELYSTPYRTTISGLVDEDLLDQVPNPQSIKRLRIFAEKNGELVSFELEDGQVIRFYWSAPGSRQSTDAALTRVKDLEASTIHSEVRELARVTWSRPGFADTSYFGT